LREFDFFIAPDRNGEERTAIKFFFQRVGKQLSYPLIFDHRETVAMDYDAVLNWNKPNETERKGLVTSRVGQGAYRKSILYRWKFSCAVTGYNRKDILIASHIIPWNEASNHQRLDVHNGILLSPNYDALFDRHLISFADSGKILLSEVLLRTNYQELGITGNETVREFSKDNLDYLEVHRKRLNE